MGPKSALRHSGFLTASATLLIVAMVALLFFVAFRSGNPGVNEARVVGQGDLRWEYGPIQFFFDSRLDAGDFPLWNSLLLSGSPLAAHPLSMAFYPPNLVRSVLVVADSPMDTLYSLRFLSLFHFMLFAVGMYGLARQEALTPSTSLAVALSTTFSAHMLDGVIMNIVHMYTVSWTPMVLLSLCKALHALKVRDRVGWLVVAGLLYGLQILAGLVQIALYATVIYVLYVAVRAGVPEGNFAFPSREALRRFAGWVGGVILFGLIGALVASAMILPAVELLSLSARATDNFGYYTSHRGFLNRSFWDILTPFMRSFWEEPGLDTARRLGNKISHWIFSLNVGLLIAGAASIFALPKRRVAIYGLLVYVLLDLCIGPPFPVARVFEALVFSASASTHGFVLLIVPLGILAGIGVEAVFSRVSHGKFPLRMTLYLLCTGLLLIFILPEPTGASGQWNYKWALIPFCILILMTFCSRYPRCRYVVLALLVVEAAVCSRESIDHEFTSRRWPKVATPKMLKMSPPTEVSQARSISQFMNHTLWSLKRAMNGYDPLVLHSMIPVLADPGDEKIYRRTMRMNRNRSAVSFLKRPFWLVPAYVDGGLPDKNRLFPPGHVVFLSDAGTIPLPKLALEDIPRTTIPQPRSEDVLWFGAGKKSCTFVGVSLPKRNSALLVDYRGLARGKITVRIWGEGRSEYISFSKIWTDWTGRDNATIEFPLPDFPKVKIVVTVKGRAPRFPLTINRVSIVSDLSDESGLIHTKYDTPDLAILEVRDAPGPRALVFTDAAYPGWQASVDGAPVPIYLANDAFKAVLIPKGTHEIRFEFRPWRVSVGVTVSMVTAIAGLLSLLWLFRRDRESVSSTIRSS